MSYSAKVELQNVWIAVFFVLKGVRAGTLEMNKDVLAINVIGLCDLSGRSACKRKFARSRFVGVCIRAVAISEI